MLNCGLKGRIMLAIKRRLDIIFIVMLVEALLFYRLMWNAISSSPDREVELTAAPDTPMKDFSIQKGRFTKKQLRIILLLLEGKSNSQISLELSVCTRTVEYHLSRIYESLGISSRGEAIIKLIHLFKK